MKRPAFNAAIGSPPAVQFIAVADLNIDATYQRSAEVPQSRNLINRIAKDWDWRLCMPLMVSERAGALWVIDGQHRLSAALQRGDIAHLPCCVIKFDSAQAESEMFVQANKNRKALTAIDLFRAAVAAGSSTETRTFELITAAGLKVSNHTNTASLAPGALTIVNGVTRAITRYGEGIVSTALTAMGKAFADQPIPRAALLFGALIDVLHDDTVDRDLLAKTLDMMTAAEWTEFPELSDSSPSVRISILKTIIREEMDDLASGRNA